MSGYPWLSPHFGVVATTVTVALAGFYLLVGPLRQRKRYAALVVRRVGDPDAVMTNYRFALRMQGIATVLVVAAVAVTPGISRSDLGLVAPHGGEVARSWVSVAYLCALVAVSGMFLRWRAVTGRTVPGQRLFRALLPSTPRQRRWATAVAGGAGVAEELVFRGLFTAAGVGLLGLDPVVAVGVVSVLFGLAHVYQGWLGMIGTAFAGILLSTLYLMSGSLLAPIIVHVVIDLRGLVLVPEQKPGATGRRAAGHAARPRPAGSARPAADLQDGVGEDRPVLP